MEFKNINDREAVNLVKQSKDFSENSQQRSEFIDDYETGYKKYLMYKKDRSSALLEAKQEWRSNLFVPMSFMFIETFVPHIILSLFESDPPVKLKPTNPSDYVAADIAEQLTTIQAKEDDFEVKTEEIVRDAAIGGLSVGVMSWYQDKILRKTPTRRQKKVDLLGRSFTLPGFVEEVVEQEHYRFNGPRLETVDPHDFYPDVSKSSIRDMRFCIRDLVLYEDEIEALYEQGVFLNRAAWTEAKKSDRREHMTGRQERRLKTFDKTIKDVASLRSYLITEYMEDNRLIYVIDNDFCVRNTDNPNWHQDKHFVDVRTVVIPHQYYPKNLIWSVKDIQDAVNDLYNQKADNVHYLLNSMMAVVEDEILYPSDLVPRPGGRVRVRNNASTAIQPILAANVTQDAYAQQAELMEMGQNASGIFDIVKGQMSRKETATVGALLANAASARLQLVVRRIAKTFLKRAWMLMVELDRQNLTIPRAIEMVGEEDAEGVPIFMNVDRYSLPQGMLNYSPKVSMQHRREMEAKRALDAYNLFYGKPEFNQYGLAELASMKTIDFTTKTPILLDREQYEERMERMARQQESLELKGMNEEPVIPPPGGAVGDPRGRPDAPVRQQSMSPEMMRQLQGSPELAIKEGMSSDVQKR